MNCRIEGKPVAEVERCPLEIMRAIKQVEEVG